MELTSIMVGFGGMVAVPAPYHVRTMALQDLGAVMQIERAVMPTPWREEGYQRELASNSLAHYFVVLEDEMLLGYGGYWLIADEAHISIIAVASAQQRRGFGQLLLLTLLDDAIGRGAETAMLEVRRSNLAAQSLYRQFGFQVVGERLRYYKDTGEDAILMNLEISSAAVVSFLAELWSALRLRLLSEV